jgi:hypothetical protein
MVRYALTTVKISVCESMIFLLGFRDYHHFDCPLDAQRRSGSRSSTSTNSSFCSKSDGLIISDPLWTASLLFIKAVQSARAHIS